MSSHAAIPQKPPAPGRIANWKLALKLAGAAALPLILAQGIVVVPSGMAGVRVSQTVSTLAGTL